jgi:hypothetical protein
MSRNPVVVVTLAIAIAHLSPASASASDSPASTTREPLVIPIEIRDNYPILMATVAGIEIPLKFDLGDGDPLVLHQEVLDQLGADATGATAKRRGIDGVFEAPLYKLPRIQIGTATFEDVIARADVRAGDYKPGEQGEKGYLGTGLLKEYVIAIDYRGRKMTLIAPLDDRQVSRYCPGIAVPFLPEWNGAPVTGAETDWGRAVVWWDTGAPVSVLRETFKNDPDAKSRDVTATTKRFVLGDADLGPVEFNFWAMELPKFDGFVGYNFFERHIVCVDFPGNKLIIGPG